MYNTFEEKYDPHPLSLALSLALPPTHTQFILRSLCAMWLYGGSARAISLRFAGNHLLHLFSIQIHHIVEIGIAWPVVRLLFSLSLSLSL